MSKNYMMKSGKNAEMAKHDASDAFVKSQQAKLASKGGKNPSLEEKYTKFNAEMINDGMHAQDLARSMTSGLDKEAFPVK